MIINIFETSSDSIHPQWEKCLRNILYQASEDLSLSVVPAHPELQEALRQWELKNEILELNKPKLINNQNRLFIPSAPEFYKRHCINELPYALYGCCLWGEYIAVEYAPAKYKLSTQLHECLHLFGVDECYDPVTKKPISECASESCVMRFGMNSTKVCSHVLSQLNR